MTNWELSDWALATGIVVVAVIISVWLGGVLTVAVLRRASRSPDSAKHPETKTRGLTGGRWIGKLERFGVTLSIIAGYPAAIAVIVAIKGLGRFPEIRRSSDASEKFVIGTLTSLLVSAVVGGLALWVMHWLWPDMGAGWGY